MGVLDDKVAIVTGSARGIGRATAELLVGEGCRVAITARDGDVLQRAVEELGGGDRVLGVQGDMTQPDDVERAVDATLERFGRIDVLVTCAGILRDRMIFNMSEEEWDAVIAVHLRGHFLLTRNAATYWRS